MTPYVTPTVLVNADTGIDWATLIPGKPVNDPSVLAEQARICWAATEMSDSYCNQILRATQDTQHNDAPDDRATLQPNGWLRVWLDRWPVLSIVNVQVALKVAPLTYSTVPVTSCLIRGNSTDLASGAGAYTIEIAPGYVDWSNGRGGYDVQVQFQNGWPHAGLSAAVLAGATTVPVDDCTGMNGQTVTIYDGANTETVAVTAASATTGPGTLTLNAALAFDHAKGTIISGLPSTVQQAAIYLASYVAMTRGTTALALPAVHGLDPAGKGGGDAALLEEGYALLNPFRRVI